MKTTKTLVAGMTVVLLAAFGCGKSEALSEQPSQGESHSYSWNANGASAHERVLRQKTADGGEILRGTTEVTLPGAAHPEIVTEMAEIDAAGRLVRASAELAEGPLGTRVVRKVVLDARGGVVKIDDPMGQRSFNVPADHPWLYSGMFNDVAPHAAGLSAVQTWVAQRAASAGSRVRFVEVLPARSTLTMADQVVFRDGETSLVVVGDDVAETDRGFVRGLSWRAVSSVSTAICAVDACSPGPV